MGALVTVISVSYGGLFLAIAAASIVDEVSVPIACSISGRRLGWSRRSGEGALNLELDLALDREQRNLGTAACLALERPATERGR
jgi:hypothetical protein